ncbi:pantoate--beta-alanine ligase [Psychroflexus planctonicus]|uniref:Pantothenate synthetase n=1 Tax=Psychroflexus planctonicus TaxID=1526575 RepID=A0ABQ1SC42_9FLAO|nr:pantoate--beta-alanine ligase [Psychroflexus planctonicus]GGE25384.1 pantothenate synthetase [Psychroflexus planctonicus]
MLVNQTSKLQTKLKKAVNKQQKVGLVPTMGALHSGHLALIGEAQKICEQVVVSIFVNPTQFNNASDLEKYPRNLEQDLAQIQSSYPNVIVFAPEVSEIYGKNVAAEEFDFGSITTFMEGEYRAGHFNGVGTIIKRLFNLVKPDFAFFGEKDFQQLRVIQKLVEITEQPVKVVGCATQREVNGLAKSSRNQRLTEEQKEKAAIIYQALETAKNKFNQSSIAEIKTEIKGIFEAYPEFELEYFEIADVKHLVPTETKQTNTPYRAFIAAFVNEVRLIDNIALNY